MSHLQKLSGFALLAQVVIGAGLLVIFFVVLPAQGFSSPQDFNDPARIASTPFAMLFIVWSDLLFGLTTLVSVFVLDQLMRTRLPLAAQVIVTPLLLGTVGFFIAHDLGIHVLGWTALARDPAATNYALDRVLWAVRDGVFFAVSLLTVLAANSARQLAQSDPLAKPG